MRDRRTGVDQQAGDGDADQPGSTVQEAVHSYFRRDEIIFGDELRAQELERQGDRRQQHQHRVDGAGVSEALRSQAVGHHQVVGEVVAPTTPGLAGMIMLPLSAGAQRASTAAVGAKTSPPGTARFL